MTASRKTSHSDVLHFLRQRYVNDLDERLELLKDLLRRIEQRDLTAFERGTLVEAAHKLSGSGATYGFPDITRAARNIEEILDSKPQTAKAILSRLNGAGLPPEDCTALIELTQRFRKACRKNGLDVPGEAAEYLEHVLGQKYEIPRQTIAQLIRNLIAHCANARLASTQIASPDEAEIPPLHQPRLPASEKTGPHPLILIVDDDQDAREILAACVKPFAEAAFATNARQAFSVMKSQRPALVLLDDKMPGEMSGLKLLEAIHEKPDINTIPVMMISASVDPETAIEAFRTGAVDYMSKPFDADILSARVERRLEWIGTSILLVEDDYAVSNLLVRAFAAAGLTTRVAHNGRLALDMMTLNRPDLILLDWGLPGLNGTEVLKVMRGTARLASVPVVFLTAERVLRDMPNELGATISGYIVKPFDVDAVVGRCCSILEKRRGETGIP